MRSRDDHYCGARLAPVGPYVNCSVRALFDISSLAHIRHGRDISRGNILHLANPEFSIELTMD
jgi:hypothetical protein